MLGDKGCEPARQSMRAHDAPGRDGQLTAFEGEIARAQLLDLNDILDDTHRKLAERRADVGQLHIAAYPLEQRQPEGRFEATPPSADRALGETERLSARGDVLAF